MLTGAGAACAAATEITEPSQDNDHPNVDGNVVGDGDGDGDVEGSRS